MTFTKRSLGAAATTMGIVLVGALQPAEAAQRGAASWYGPGFHGRRTASGERFNSGGLTAAHRTLPFGSHVLVTNERTGRSVVVRINDRGPFTRGRIIDISQGAARAIGMSGTATVRLSQR